MSEEGEKPSLEQSSLSQDPSGAGSKPTQKKAEEASSGTKVEVYVGNGSSRKKFLMGFVMAGVAAGLGVVGGQKLGEQGSQACKKKLSETEQALSQTEQEKKAVDNQLTACRNKVSGLEGEKEVLENFNASQIEKLQEENKALQEKNKELEEQIAALQEELKATREGEYEYASLALQEAAKAKVFKDLLEGRIYDAISGARLMVEAIPVKFIDDAINGIEDLEQRLNSFFVSLGDLIVPLKEYVVGVQKIYAPLINFLDDFFKGWAKFNAKIEEAEYGSLEDFFQKIADILPEGDLKKYFQEASQQMARLAGESKAYINLLKDPNYTPFLDLLAEITKKIEEIDNKLSKWPRKIIGEVKEAIISKLQSLKEQIEGITGKIFKELDGTTNEVENTLRVVKNIEEINVANIGDPREVLGDPDLTNEVVKKIIEEARNKQT